VVPTEWCNLIWTTLQHPKVDTRWPLQLDSERSPYLYTNCKIVQHSCKKVHSQEYSLVKSLSNKQKQAPKQVFHLSVLFLTSPTNKVCVQTSEWTCCIYPCGRHGMMDHVGSFFLLLFFLVKVEWDKQLEGKQRCLQSKANSLSFIHLLVKCTSLQFPPQ
jgi:hypothetical protein